MTFYLNLFFIYLPTIKDVVGYYKFRNEVMVWFVQMICLHPIIFHIIDPTSTHLLTLVFCSWMFKTSILINLFIKLELNNFLLPPLLSIVFVQECSVVFRKVRAEKSRAVKRAVRSWANV